MNIHADVLEPDARATLMRSFYPGQHARFDRVVFRAEADGATVGTARIGPAHDNFGPWVGQLHELLVVPAHRRRGIGARLHDACLATWRAAGITVGVLEVATPADQDFFEARGWAPDGHTRGASVRLRRAIN